MTQYQLVQTRPAQSKAALTKIANDKIANDKIANDSLRLMLYRLAVGVAATMAIACQAQSSSTLPKVVVSSTLVAETATVPSDYSTYQGDRSGFHTNLNTKRSR